MSIHLSQKNNYIISQRNYLDDYFNTEKKSINMTISGKFLGQYPKFNINNRFDEYINNDEIKELIKIIKKKYKIKDEIILGPGSNGLLQNIIKILMIDGGNLITPFYSFNEAEYASTSLNCITKRVLCNKYKIDFKSIEKSIDNETKCIYICNPNNPTGIYEKIENIIKLSKNINIPIIVDESCIEFTMKKSLLDYKLPDNIIVLRSFSKAYGLANLRIGFMVCKKEFKKIYEEKITINEISSIAVESAINMLKNYKLVEDNINKVILEREKIKKSLENKGISCTNSESNILFTIDKFKPNKNISLVKVLDENNKDHYRIAIQDIETNNKFIKEINRR